ncbi:hypothetical protein D3C87_1246800 [compost metagenome]
MLLGADDYAHHVLDALDAVILHLDRTYHRIRGAKGCDGGDADAGRGVDHAEVEAALFKLAEIHREIPNRPFDGHVDDVGQKPIRVQQGNRARDFGYDRCLVKKQCARRHLQTVLTHGFGEIPGVQIHHERFEPLFSGVKCDVDGVSCLADTTFVLCNYNSSHVCHFSVFVRYGCAATNARLRV